MYPFNSSHPRIRTFPYYFRMASRDRLAEFYDEAKIHGLVWCQDFLELGDQEDVWLLFKHSHHAIMMKLTYGGT